MTLLQEETEAHLVGNTLLFNSPYITTFCSPQEPALLHAVVTIIKRECSDFKIKVRALIITDGGPFFQRCFKELHMNVNFRRLPAELPPFLHQIAFS